MQTRLSATQGLSVVEFMVALGIFSVVSLVGYQAFIQTHQILKAEQLAHQARWLAEEGSRAAYIIGRSDFEGLQNGESGLQLVDGSWGLASAPETIGMYTRELAISESSLDTKEVVTTVSYDHNGSEEAAVSRALITFWQQSVEVPMSLEVDASGAYLRLLSGWRTLTGIDLVADGEGEAVITSITVSWTKNSRQLSGIYSPDGSQIFSGSVASGETVTLDTPITLQSGQSRSIEFAFNRSMNNSDYTFKFGLADGNSAATTVEDPPTGL